MTALWFGVTLDQLLLIFAIVFAAGFVRGLTGFGLAVILVPLVNLVIAPEQTVLLAILIGTLSGFLGFRGAWASCDKVTTTTITLSAIAATPLGLYLLFHTPTDIARLAIAAMAVIAFFAVALPRSPLPPSGKGPAILTGALAGLMGSFAGIPGPPVLYYLARDGVPPARTRDAMIVIFLWAPLAVAVFAFAAGKLNWPLAALAAASFPPLALGNAIGTRFFGRMPETWWRTAVLLIIAASAAGAVIQAID